MILLHVRRLREASFLNEYLIVVIVHVKNLHSRLCLTPLLHMMIVTLNTNNFCSWSQSLITQVGWWGGGEVGTHCCLQILLLDKEIHNNLDQKPRNYIILTFSC